MKKNKNKKGPCSCFFCNVYLGYIGSYYDLFGSLFSTVSCSGSIYSLRVVCLQDFLKWNESHLKQLPCQISDPIPLGEGAGVGQLKDVDNMAMPEGSTLYDLINTGIKHTHAAVGVVVRLRKELSLVKNIPVLIAIDQVRPNFLHQLHTFSCSLG